MKLPSPKTDNQDVLLAMIHHGSLTTIELKKITKSSYPPARIFNLKEAGISFIPKQEDYINRRNVKTKITRYILATPKREAIELYKKLCSKNSCYE